MGDGCFGAGAPTVFRGDVQFIHQAVDGSQAGAAGAGSGEAISQSPLDIGDARAAITRFDLQADPPVVGQRRQGQRSALGVLDQVGGEFGHGEGDFFAGYRVEPDAFR
jgi:hypothetical protein